MTSAFPRQILADNHMQRTIGEMTFGYEAHGEGTPVFFLHGLPTDRRSMVPRFEPLFARADAPRGFRRIYLDSPGAGETPSSAAITTHDDYVAAIARFIEDEARGERFALVGTSWGAYHARAYATLHVERLLGLALFVPGHGPDHDPTRPPKTVLVREPGIFEGQPEPLVASFSSAATVHTRAVFEQIASSVAPGGRSADHAFLGAILKQPLSYASRLAELEYGGPVLVAAGRQDSIVGYADAWPLAQQFPRATFAVLDRAAHAMQTEQNTLLTALFREWLARVREGMGAPYEP